MLVYCYDEETKEFSYEEEAHIDPLETELKGENVYLLPANATFEKPLEAKEGFRIVFDNSWKYEAIPVEIEKEPEPLTYAEKRAMEYPSIQDQLDMIYWDKVNGTNTWQEKITEIKAKYPKEVVVSETENTEEVEPIEKIEELPVVEEMIVSETETVDIVD